MWKTDDGRSFEVYEASRHDGLFMVSGIDCDLLVAKPELGFDGELVSSGDERWILAPLSHRNADRLRAMYPFTAPSRVLGRDKTMGVGDRLGIATDGHLMVFRDYPQVTPILAQQSIRELNLTNRTFNDVIDCATFAVFRNDYTTGWGADGDHVKTAEEVEYALSSGCTMITLDCSEQIDNSIEGLSSNEVDSRYERFKAGDGAYAQELESIYLGKTFDVGEGHSIVFDADMFRRCALIYSKAIAHAIGIYRGHILSGDGSNAQRADFEVSIDETMTPTHPAQHFFVANELTRANVHIATVAPRFCGEFQKGIDYIGDLSQFEQEMKVHAAIARHFGYKLSIHSGSDKFSIFPYAGRETRGRFHLKTAGTNWLEAMKLVAMKDPSLYRKVHRFALGAFGEATKYYHVTTDLSKIPDIDTLEDSQLVSLFSMNDARQLIHITYGLILNAKDSNGDLIFKDRLYRLWRTYREDYAKLLHEHIGNHLKAILV